MSKQQTLGDVLADPPRMGRESDIVKRMKRNVRKFDEYEARETYAVCIHCPDEANYHKENELFWDDEFQLSSIQVYQFFFSRIAVNTRNRQHLMFLSLSLEKNRMAIKTLKAILRSSNGKTRRINKGCTARSSG